MKKNKLDAFLWLSMLLTLLAALAFFNNIVAVAKWWAQFLSTGGNANALGGCAKGFIPWLDWSIVDYSCASTLIPFIGLSLLTLAIWKIKTHRVIDTEHFPFYKASDQLNIALGLIGTLWGIILIGYYDLETVKMTDLMTCLHTALFSTLVAVAWVFLIDHPIIRPFARKLLRDEGLATEEDTDLCELLERLKTGASGLGSAWEAEKSRLLDLSDTLDFVKNSFVECSKSAHDATTLFKHELPDSVKTLIMTLTEAGDKFDERQRAYDEVLSKRVTRIEEEHAGIIKLIADTALVIDAMRETQTSLSTTITQTVTDNAALRDKLAAEVADGNRIRAKSAELSGALCTTKAQLFDLRDTTEKAANEHRKAVERFRNEILALENEKTDLGAKLKQATYEGANNAARADKAERILAKIRSTFGQE